MLKISTTAIPLSFVGKPFEFLLQCECYPVRRVRWLIAKSTPLPFGLRMDEEGNVKGTPQRVQMLSVQFEAVAEFPDEQATAILNMKVYEPLSVDEFYLPKIVAGMPFQQTLTARGGVPPYAWKTDSLPLGLMFEDGVFSGVPRAEGGFVPVLITVEDSVGNKLEEQIYLRSS